jgi:hypothetical protein
MESGQQILSEIKDMMTSIRRQIEQLDLKMAELQQIVESQESDADSVVLELDDLPFFDEVEPIAPVELVEISEPVSVIEQEFTPAQVVEVEMEAEAEAEPEIEQELLLQNEEPAAPINRVARRAVIDAMTDKQAWRKDMPGTPVRDIRSAISLNDRVLFINTLFGEDPVRFQEVLTFLNQMSGLDEAVAFLSEQYPDWNFESETVYRFMMAVRRKLN